MKTCTLARYLIMVAATLSLIATLSVSSAALAATPTAAQSAGQPIKLKVASSVPTTHYQATVQIEPWMARVKELTGDKVQFEYYPAEQLGRQADYPSLLKTGVADVAITPFSAFPGTFPLTSVAGLPIESDIAKVTYAFRELLKEGPVADEFAKLGLRVLWNNGNPPYEAWTTKKAVTNLGDFKGLKLRTGGGPGEIALRFIGAVPVQMQAMDIYTAIQRGTIDGALLACFSIQGYKLHEQVKYMTVGSVMRDGVVGWSMSAERWSKLPADVQAAIEKASHETTERTIKYLVEDNQRLYDVFEKAGLKAYRLTASDQAQWKQALAGVSDEWVKQMAQKGLPGQQVVDAYKKALAKQ